MNRFVAVVWVVALCTGCAGERPVADHAFTNGKFYTVDGRSRWVDAVAVKDGRFIMVGDAVDVGEVTGASTRVVDLEGRFVMPGLVESGPKGGSDSIGSDRVSEHLMAIQQVVTATDHPISLGKAIAVRTRDAAVEQGTGSDVGSIEVGKRADMIVFDRNPFQMPQDAIATVKVVRIISGGETVHERAP